jgi:transketolase
MDKVVSTEKLQRIAFEIRKNIILSLSASGSGHLGGSLGLADVFTALYFNVLNHKPKDPDWEHRDRLILSAGHVAPVLYSVLAQAGYFHSRELFTLRQLGSRLQGHPGKEHGLPGIEISSGSLGQGLSVGVGISLAAKLDSKNIHVFVILGDGELQEGSNWEAAMSASKFRLDNLIAIVDRNYKQIDGDTETVMPLEPLAEKWTAFGWDVTACDGNNIEEVCEVLNKMKHGQGAPKVIIAKTKMGKGVSSIEDDFRWHGKAPSANEAEQFMNELQQSFYDV